MIISINKNNRPKRPKNIPIKRTEKYYCGTFNNDKFFCSKKDLYNKINYIKMDLKTCKKNLLTFDYLMSFFKIPFYIIYGTLLGAVREKNFIAYDNDTDTAILNGEINNLNILLKSKKFTNSGFEVCRTFSDLVTITRDGEVIDIYVFRNKNEKYYCQKGASNSDPLNFFDNPSTISFLGKNFQTVQNPEKYFLLHYGKDWKTPKRGWNTHAH